MNDRIELRGLRVMAVVGVLPEEQERAQPFEIDVDVHTDMTAAITSDDLADTVDYAGLTDRIVRVMHDGPHVLLERVAARIADVALDAPGADAVDVVVRKLRPPVPHDLASSGVRLHRARS